MSYIHGQRLRGLGDRSSQSLRWGRPMLASPTIFVKQGKQACRYLGTWYRNIHTLCNDQPLRGLSLYFRQSTFETINWLKRQGHQEFWVEKWNFWSKIGHSEIWFEKSQDAKPKWFLVPPKPKAKSPPMVKLVILYLLLTDPVVRHGFGAPLSTMHNMSRLTFRHKLVGLNNILIIKINRLRPTSPNTLVCFKLFYIIKI